MCRVGTEEERASREEGEAALAEEEEAEEAEEEAEEEEAGATMLGWRWGQTAGGLAWTRSWPVRGLTCNTTFQPPISTTRLSSS